MLELTFGLDLFVRNFWLWGIGRVQLYMVRSLDNKLIAREGIKFGFVLVNNYLWFRLFGRKSNADAFKNVNHSGCLCDHAQVGLD